MDIRDIIKRDRSLKAFLNREVQDARDGSQVNVNVPECHARMKLGRSEPPAALAWPLCGYRCFTLRLVKLREREKLLPQFVREGGGCMGGWGGYTGAALYMDTVLTHVTVLCLLNASAFQSSARKRPYCF